MKNTLFKNLLALSALSLAGTAAHANTVSASPGDLILNFQIDPFAAAGTTGSAINVEVSLGNFQNFLPGGSDATGSPVTLSNLNVLDLSNVNTYGPAWDTSGNLQWSVVGASGASAIGATPKQTLFGTVANNSEVPLVGNQSAQTSVTGLVNNSGEIGALSGLTATANSAFTGVAATSDNGSYNTEAGAPGTFGFFDGTFQNVANGVSTSELYEFKPSPVSGTTAIDLGTFSLSSTGLTFTSVQAVPEPSTWISIILGAATLIGLRRRRLA